MEMREERPAYVRFEARAIEDRNESISQGHYVTKNVDFVLITPPFSKDCVSQEVTVWMKTMDDQVSAGRLPGKWRDNYKAQYEAWKRDEELPLDGTPIKGWALLSPAQQQNLITIGVRTVEDLAAINDEGQKRYGMGALDLKNKAQAWLKSSQSFGAVAQENAALKAKVADQETTIKSMEEKLAELAARLDEVESRKKRQAA